MSLSSTTPENLPIQMRGVSVGAMRDANLTVLDGVNWTVAPGDFWVIGGLQGSGKSDFLLMTGGLMSPLEGTYFLFGGKMPIFEDARLRERLRMGIVFDGGQLLNHLTISENIALPLRYHRNLTKAEAETEVRGMLEVTELAPWADSTPGAIGRNWRKRAGLARALMLKPEVLLLDNPLAGLDVRHRVWWLNFLREFSEGHEWMNRSPTTIVVTADDLRPWRNRARHVAVLKDKRFLVLGNWAEALKANDELIQEFFTGAQTD
ncbi:MAG TPA: ATP-binding cassette domain-containing protein [Verrucomicrobiae bacterium]|nr:ATP-binding cassette domain-containing protein [Verrucomicrobiae bacterium]